MTDELQEMLATLECLACEVKFYGLDDPQDQRDIEEAHRLVRAIIERNKKDQN